MMTCPICQTPIDVTEKRASKPFCSDRCRRIDLGRWLNEDYGVRWDGGSDELAEAAESDSQSDDDAW